MNRRTPACFARRASEADPSPLMAYVTSGLCWPSGSFDSSARCTMASKPWRSACGDLANVLRDHRDGRMWQLRTACRRGSTRRRGRRPRGRAGPARAPSRRPGSRRFLSSTRACSGHPSNVLPSSGRRPASTHLATARGSSHPGLPRRIAGSPEILEHVLFLQRIHARPEAEMAECHQLAVAREPFDRLTLPDGVVAVDVVEHAWIEREEAAVNPAFAVLGLLLEGGDLVAVESDTAEAGGRPHRGDRRQPPVPLVEIDQAS